MKTRFCWRVTGSPRAMRRVMVLIAAQRIIASEVPTGALTAVAGILLLGGNFVPG